MRENASIMVEICKGAVRSILVPRDFDLKSSMTQQTKVLQTKETLQVIRRVLPIRQDIAY